ncbi:GTPase HflX [Oceaniradius stylonematis]|jgi:GTP-binding protein HflX|uniref:GTPase HflX n=1 Tax=Oceaniradius stylonematis TaxID=2184161 RepID=UPI000F3FD1B0|nr:GTPase HflX [Oceaniradius stylonematis]RNC95047.1 MAG: GTPase HflX [Oricola sp.]
MKQGRGGGVDRRGEPTRAVVLAPDIAKRDNDADRAGLPVRTAGERLAEAAGLARAIDLVIADQMVVPVAKPVPATLIGSGKVAELAGVIAAHEAGLVVVDHALTPVQQRNLEKAWNAKVLDRTGLILEIFGRRARTKEGSLQVELAHLNYQRGRLVRSWTHLERQRGGAGFLGGPGETQIEADRRILRDKIKRLETELEQVRRTRTLHRAKRRKVPLPVVALVGYTNAGKSTLFNRLTGAAVMAEDMLFATLDPTLRRVRLPGGTEIILSDTVGFISDLPTHLVAAFRATLEEVEEADLIVHVHDASDPQAAAQSSDVRAVLAELDVTPDDEHVIEVHNKTDALDADARAALSARVSGQGEVAVSALTGEGMDALLALIEERIAGALVTRQFTVPAARFADVAWLYENAVVRDRQDGDDGSVSVSVQMTRDTADAYDRRTARVTEKTG